MANKTNIECGFELLHKTAESDIHKKEDVIILLAHWYFVKYGFKCLGNGVSRIFDPSDKGTELLPEEWNKTHNYKLRYVKDGKLFLFYGLKSDEDMVMNLLRAEDEQITNINFSLIQTIKELHGPLEVMVPSHRTVFYKLYKELLEPLIPNAVKDGFTQTSLTSFQQATRNPDLTPLTNRRSHNLDCLPDSELRRIGASDLDPFGRIGCGGGMLFDPFRIDMNSRVTSGLGVPGRLPPGAVPLGARFDPFGPPETLPYRPRDPDDMLPPREHNMFL